VAQAEVIAGICGMQTHIETQLLVDGQTVSVRVESPCAGVMKLVEQLGDVNAFQEITYRREGPRVLQLAPQCLPHPACPVPAALIKAVEVAAGLALPRDATITIKA